MDALFFVVFGIGIGGFFWWLDHRDVEVVKVPHGCYMMCRKTHERIMKRMLEGKSETGGVLTVAGKWDQGYCLVDKNYTMDAHFRNNQHTSVDVPWSEFSYHTHVSYCTIRNEEKLCPVPLPSAADVRNFFEQAHVLKAHFLYTPKFVFVIEVPCDMAYLIANLRNRERGKFNRLMDHIADEHNGLFSELKARPGYNTPYGDQRMEREIMNLVSATPIPYDIQPYLNGKTKLELKVTSIRVEGLSMDELLLPKNRPRVCIRDPECSYKAP